MIISIHQPQYIPWLGYFDKMAKSNYFVFLDQAQYETSDFQNRNKIRTREGWIWLTVPVISKGRSKQEICNVAINNKLPWRRKHLESLRFCYGRSNFFNKYFSFFEDVYTKNWERLIDLNVHIIKYIMNQLSISTPIYFESQLNIAHKGTGRIIEICRKLKADTYLSGIGGRDYLKEEKFVKADIRLVYQDFVHPLYQQQFMSDDQGFIPNISILDLLFNEGPRSIDILNRGGKK